MSRTYLCVALDHGASFDNWLTHWDATLDERTTTKRALLALAMEAQVEAVVLGPDFAARPEFLASVVSEHGADLWIGLPDQVFSGADPLGPWLPELEAWSATGATGIKMGVSVDPNSSWSKVADYLDLHSQTFGSVGLALVVEPYFLPTDESVVREAFLRRIGALPMLQFAKLDLSNPTKWSPVYDAAGLPWVARSQGLSYRAYASRIAAAADYGCVGAMAGGALWGIDAPLLSTEFVTEFMRRVDGIRTILSQ